MKNIIDIINRYKAKAIANRGLLDSLGWTEKGFPVPRPLPHPEPPPVQDDDACIELGDGDLDPPLGPLDELIKQRSPEPKPAMTWCPEHGFGVKLDGYRFCYTCGHPAVGDGVLEAIRYKKEHAFLLKMLVDIERVIDHGNQQQIVVGIKRLRDLLGTQKLIDGNLKPGLVRKI